jgi:hypothetical protein
MYGLNKAIEHPEGGQSSNRKIRTELNISNTVNRSRLKGGRSAEGAYFSRIGDRATNQGRLSSIEAQTGKEQAQDMNL